MPRWEDQDITSDAYRAEVFGKDRPEGQAIAEQLEACPHFEIVPLRTQAWDMAGEMRKRCQAARPPRSLKAGGRAAHRRWHDREGGRDLDDGREAGELLRRRPAHVGGRLLCRLPQAAQHRVLVEPCAAWGRRAPCRGCAEQHGA